jgi:hypothetical protein
MAFEHHPGLHALWLALEGNKQKTEEEAVVKEINEEKRVRKAQGGRETKGFGSDS